MPRGIISPKCCCDDCDLPEASCDLPEASCGIDGITLTWVVSEDTEEAWLVEICDSNSYYGPSETIIPLTLPPYTGTRSINPGCSYTLYAKNACGTTTSSCINPCPPDPCPERILYPNNIVTISGVQSGLVTRWPLPPNDNPSLAYESSYADAPVGYYEYTFPGWAAINHALSTYNLNTLACDPNVPCDYSRVQVRAQKIATVTATKQFISIDSTQGYGGSCGDSQIGTVTFDVWSYFGQRSHFVDNDPSLGLKPGFNYTDICGPSFVSAGAWGMVFKVVDNTPGEDEVDLTYNVKSEFIPPGFWTSFGTACYDAPYNGGGPGPSGDQPPPPIVRGTRSVGFKESAYNVGNIIDITGCAGSTAQPCTAVGELFGIGFPLYPAEIKQWRTTCDGVSYHADYCDPFYTYGLTCHTLSPNYGPIGRWVMS